jgi:hypothetical protein
MMRVTLLDTAPIPDLSIKHALMARTMAFIAVSVNLGSSADIGLHAGFTWTK